MAELGLDGSGFASGLRRAEGLAQGAASSIGRTIVGLVGVGTIGLAIEKTVESAKQLVDASERLGIGVESIQVLRKAAADAGAEFSNLEKAFERIDLARRKALTPGEVGQDARRAFAGMGIGAEQLRSMTAAQLFTGPMAHMAQRRNPEEIGAYLRGMGIKDFGELIPVLKTNLEALAKSMKEYGALTDAVTAVKLKNLGDEFTMVSQVITSHLGPALVRLAEFIYTDLLKGAKTVAGATAFYGGGTAEKQGLLSSIWSVGRMLPAGAWAMLNEKILGRWSHVDAKMFLQATGEQVGFNTAAGAAAATEAEKPWQGKLDEFAKLMARMAERAKELNNQVPPDFTGEAPKVGRKALEVPMDSLTRVGNFLGGGGNVIQRLAQQRTEYLRQIAQNTAKLQSAGRTTSSMAGMPPMTDPWRTSIPTF